MENDRRMEKVIVNWPCLEPGSSRILKTSTSDASHQVRAKWQFFRNNFYGLRRNVIEPCPETRSDSKIEEDVLGGVRFKI